MESSCSCAVVSPSELSLVPHSSKVLHLKIDPGETNADGSLEEIPLAFRLVPGVRSQRGWTVSGKVVVPFVLDSRVAVVVEGTHLPVKAFTLSMCGDLVPIAMTLHPVELGRLEFQKGESPGEYPVSLALGDVPHDIAKPLEGVVKVEFNDPQVPVNTVDFRFAIKFEPRVIAWPATTVLGHRKVGSSHEVHIALKADNGKELELRDIEAPAGIRLLGSSREKSNSIDAKLAVKIRESGQCSYPIVFTLIEDGIERVATATIIAYGEKGLGTH